MFSMRDADRGLGNLDLEKMTRFVPVGEGGLYGMSDKQVLRTALDNWVRRVDRFEIQDFGKLRSFHFGEGDYNASILLLENLWKDVPSLPRNVTLPYRRATSWHSETRMMPRSSPLCGR
jgi:hypothetical protein